jgi:cardiolipin synthase (CMP-forming)
VIDGRRASYERMGFDWFRWLPNFITIGRLALTPAAIAMVADHKWNAAFSIFVVAALSDALDGWLAKTFELQTELGAALDPLADKALIVTTFAALAIAGAAPPWLAILVVSRDVMILGGVGASWLLSRPVTIRPHILSKATTVAQLSLAGLILAGEAFDFRFEAMESMLIGSVAALTIASASVYLWLWVQHMRP